MKNGFKDLSNRILFMCSVMLLFALSSLVMAQVLPAEIPTSGDPFQTLITLISQGKVMGGVGIGMMVIILVVQLLKSDKLEGFFKIIPEPVQLFIIHLVGAAYTIMYMVFYQKISWLSALVMVLITSQGAIAIFNSFKLAFLKPKPKPAGQLQ